MTKSRLRAARERMGISQDELSRRCGVPRGTIHEIENLRHTPGIDRAAQLYSYFGLDLEDALADFGIQRVEREEVKL